ncbi:MAG: tetratricopeptide repeat protein [Allosphingosinicella sp.]|uniref:tetratricopeptide repeat protein n=1 Tax=Allosphingosinicella sp. TaxID=2823234 RepID=UPI0039329FFA
MMPRFAALTAVALAAFAVPATAAVMAVGTTSARLCYEAARSPLTPTPGDLRRCDMALTQEALVGYEVVATYVNRGILKVRRGNVESGILDFDMALARDPNQAEAYLNKGVALMRRENVGDALPLFTVALEKNTQRPALAHYARGVAHEALGNVREAFADYQRASQIEPEWQEPRIELSRFQVRGQR